MKGGRHLPLCRALPAVVFLLDERREGGGEVTVGHLLEEGIRSPMPQGGGVPHGHPDVRRGGGRRGRPRH